MSTQKSHDEGSVHLPDDVDPEHSEFLARLEHILEEKHMSRRALAAKIGLSSTGFNSYWAKRSEPTRKILISISNEMGVNIEWLTTGKGPIWRADTPPSPQRAAAQPALMLLDASALTIAMRHLEHMEQETGARFDAEGRAAAIAGLYLALMRDRAQGRTDPVDPEIK